MNGTYRFVYSGAVNVGIGIWVIKDGVIKGADLSGIRYDGQITNDPENGGFNVLFKMSIPAGTSLVQSPSHQDIDHKKIDVKLYLKPNFDDGAPSEVFIPPGPVTLMIRRTRDEESIYADGFSLTVTPKVPPHIA